FVKDLANGVIELRCGCKIPPDRLFNDDAGLVGDKIMISDLFGDGSKNRWCNGKVEGTDTIISFFEESLEFVPALFGFGIDGHIKDTFTKVLYLGLVVFARF